MPVSICYKNFAAANPSVKHIGLGVSAVNTVKVLRDNHVTAHVWPVTCLKDIEALMERDPAVDRIVINALWISTLDLSSLCNRYPHKQFIVNIHSNVGFLQADTNGVRLLREYMGLEKGLYNFRMAANSEKYCEWQRAAFGAPCLWLPNLYHLTEQDGAPRPPWQREGILRIGSFGAVRPLKNQISAAAAALVIARQLRTSLEFWITSERKEGGGEVVLNSMREMYRDLPGCTLVERGWMRWDQVRQLTGKMHLCLYPSHTESFSMVVADAIAEGVPSVVSSAIDWVPPYWTANLDDVMDIARAGSMLLHSHSAPSDGIRALREYNTRGIAAWAGV